MKTVVYPMYMKLAVYVAVDCEFGDRSPLVSVLSHRRYMFIW